MWLKNIVDTLGEVEEALRQSFIDIDAQLHNQMKKYRRFAGSTCTCSLITPNHIFTANLGDSRTLIVRKGTFIVDSE